MILSKGIYSPSGDLVCMVSFQLQIEVLDKLISSSLNPDFSIGYQIYTTDEKLVQQKDLSLSA